jgi:cellulose biosynthesis protein BcsQ
MDAQGSLSYALSGEATFYRLHESGLNLSAYFEQAFEDRARPLEAFIKRAPSLIPEAEKVDLVAAEPGLQFVERDVVGRLSGFSLNVLRSAPEEAVSRKLAKELKSLKKFYDWIVFDCPPGISVFAFAGIRNADELLMPATPDFLSYLAIQQMHNRVIPAALKGKKGVSKRILLNKCVSTSTLPGQYRERLNEYIVKNDWDATLIDYEMPHKMKFARATEASEDRDWSSFKSKYEEFDCEALVSVFEAA